MFPTDPKERKKLPVTTGVFDYFPDALMAIAEVSRVGNDQHNPGKPLHWDRDKSMDQADCIGRHLLQRGKLDSDGLRHSAKLAWRALALLQLELEAEKLDPTDDMGPTEYQLGPDNHMFVSGAYTGGGVCAKCGYSKKAHGG